MKNLIIAVGVTISFLALFSFRTDYKTESNPEFASLQEEPVFLVPENVKAILDKSCLPCHGKDGKSSAKMKWNYEKTKDLKPSKLVGRLSKIVSKVEKDKMPTAKFKKKYPDQILTDEDKKALIGWANGLIDDLIR